MIASACSRRRLSRAFSRRTLARSAVSGFGAATLGPRRAGLRAENAPASRCRRQSVRLDEYTPSRRRIAPIPPLAAARSVSSRMRSLSCTVKLRRRGRSDNSGEAAAGTGTAVGLRPSTVPVPAAMATSTTLLGMTT
jgi:hypothetical protein